MLLIWLGSEIDNTKQTRGYLSTSQYEFSNYPVDDHSVSETRAERSEENERKPVEFFPGQKINYSAAITVSRKVRDSAIG